MCPDTSDKMTSLEQKKEKGWTRSHDKNAMSVKKHHQREKPKRREIPDQLNERWLKLLFACAEEE